MVMRRAKKVTKELMGARMKDDLREWGKSASVASVS